MVLAAVQLQAAGAVLAGNWFVIPNAAALRPTYRKQTMHALHDKLHVQLVCVWCQRSLCPGHLKTSNFMSL